MSKRLLPNAASRKAKLYDVHIRGDVTLLVYPTSVTCSIDKDAPKGKYLVMGDPAQVCFSQYSVSPWVVEHPGDFLLCLINTSPIGGTLKFDKNEAVAKAYLLYDD